MFMSFEFQFQNLETQMEDDEIIPENSVLEKEYTRFRKWYIRVQAMKKLNGEDDGSSEPSKVPDSVEDCRLASDSMKLQEAFWLHRFEEDEKKQKSAFEEPIDFQQIKIRQQQYEDPQPQQQKPTIQSHQDSDEDQPMKITQMAIGDPSRTQHHSKEKHPRSKSHSKDIGKVQAFPQSENCSNSYKYLCESVRSQIQTHFSVRSQ